MTGVKQCSERVILHCDCNSFFASVETALNPQYRDVPMAVCGSQEDRHGIVLAKNDLAKAYGIKTADTVHAAKRLCPNLVIAEPHYDQYVKFSSLVAAIYADYTDKIEPFGIDESWLDVTASLRAFGSGYEIAEMIRRRVREEIGITVSIGVSFNKVFAKLGSDYKKPDAITVIDRGNYKSIVDPLPVSDMLFVGHKTVETLASFGVRTIGELADLPRSLLTEKLGKYGEMLSVYARGEDETPVESPDDSAKSIGNGYTFRRDLVGIDEMQGGVDFLTEEIARRMRDKGLVCSTVSVTIKDQYLRTVQKQRPLPHPTDICKEISSCAMSIIKDSWVEGKPVRSITVTATNLGRKSAVSDQVDMFIEEQPEPCDDLGRVRRGEVAVEDIRRRFGANSIVRGAGLNSGLGIYDIKNRKRR